MIVPISIFLTLTTKLVVNSYNTFFSFILKKLVLKILGEYKLFEVFWWYFLQNKHLFLINISMCQKNLDKCPISAFPWHWVHLFFEYSSCCSYPAVLSMMVRDCSQDTWIVCVGDLLECKVKMLFIDIYIILWDITFYI